MKSRSSATHILTGAAALAVIAIGSARCGSPGETSTRSIGQSATGGGNTPDTSAGTATNGAAAGGGTGVNIGITGGVTTAGVTTGGAIGPDGGDLPDPFCGDGLINRPGEACDDGNNIAGDGCTAECDQIESDYVCPTPGKPCVSTVKCGDGLVGGTETCDDGKAGASAAPVSGDGCDATCQIEPGFTCPVPGAACRPICGDGQIHGREQCDDGNTTPGDGCDDKCNLEAGWVCSPAGTCKKTVCGDGIVEGSEQCDDKNRHPYDGCSPDCTNEPVCGTATAAVGKCASHCGDGILLTSDNEQCDDGNKLDGDGCSATCQLEPGYKCATLVQMPPDAVDIPIVIRDFKTFVSWTGQGDPNPVGHPDFGRLCCNLQLGLVKPLLGVDKKPVYAGMGDLNPLPLTSGESYFNQWYRDVDGVSMAGINLRFDQTLHLVRQASGAYVMNSATDAPWATMDGFFPIDNEGWGNESQNHNFSFTSELRYWFEYKGGERLDFSGDDDVWVFVNGTLAVDLGGVHDRQYATVAFDAAGNGATCSGQGCTPTGSAPLAMQIGNIYEVAVFQAERHPSGSNYWITLTNFLAGKSTCAPVCGDGIVTPDEACDLGTAQNTGAHGGCNPDCTLAPFCGDGHVDVGEQCDDGVNASLYGGCAPGCVKGPFCGDGQVQAPYEQCDDGVNDGGYGQCAPQCRYGERCGDGIVQPEHEQCDDGKNNGHGTCRNDCTQQMVH